MQETERNVDSNKYDHELGSFQTKLLHAISNRHSKKKKKKKTGQTVDLLYIFKNIWDLFNLAFGN